MERVMIRAIVNVMVECIFKFKSKLKKWISNTNRMKKIVLQFPSITRIQVDTNRQFGFRDLFQEDVVKIFIVPPKWTG